MTIKAIIHDWDDTITNSFEAYTKFYFDLGNFHNLATPDIKSIKEHWGGTIVEIVSGIWPELHPAEAEEKTNSFIEKVIAEKKIYEAKVFPTIKETLLKLDTMGIKLGIVSSGDSQKMKQIYKEQIDADLRFHCFIYDNKDLGYKKPDARIFDKPFVQFKQFNIREDETIYVGDSFQDYYSAKNRNLQFYAVTSGLKTKNDFVNEGLPSAYILSSFNDVLTIFR